MAPDVERSVKSAPKAKMLTMDVIELTLLLKSIGFRLESIDYDEFRSWGKKFNDCGNGIGASATTINSNRTDADQITVEISCSKSKIVSHLSFKISDSEAAAMDTQTHTTADTTKLMACTCPKREPRNDNNSFWEVQSSGTFSNQRRSINALMNADTGIDHDTSSNLLPTLSTKSIALSHVLTQVLLNQYKSNSGFGEANAKDVDIKSIMRTIEKTNILSAVCNENVGRLPSVSQVEDLNLITPLSSMNVTPTEQEALMNVTIPKVTVNDRNADDCIARTTALNETVNTEAFSSPKSDLVTSSPHANVSLARSGERDTGVISHLNRARHSIDQALLSMKLNITRNLSQEILAPLLSTTRDKLFDNNPNRSIASQAGRMLNSRKTMNVPANARPPLSTLNRRASLGSLTGRVPARSIVSPALTSRLNVTKPNSIERPDAASSKLAMVRRAVSGISSRTIGGIAGSVKTPTTQQTTSVKRIASISRRTSSPAVVSNGSTPTTGLITRKTVSTTKITPLPSKLIKK